jgi:hypothetical protein
MGGIMSFRGHLTDFARSSRLRSGVKEFSTKILFLVLMLVWVGQGWAQNECPSNTQPVAWSRDNSDVTRQTMCEDSGGRLFLSKMTGQAGGPRFDVTAFGAKGNGATDDSDAILAAIKAAQQIGGIVFFAPGTYVANSQWVIPNDGGSPPQQNALRITGAMGSANFYSNTHTSGAIIKSNFVGTPGLIDTRGYGLLEIDHLTFIETGAAVTTPWIHTTNTTLYVHDVTFVGHSSKAGITCDQDAIVLGGNTFTQGGGPDNMFGGYGTTIENNFFDGIRTAVRGKLTVNGVRVLSNSIVSRSGSNEANGAPFILDASANAGGGDVGNFFAGNLIEMDGYPYGFRFANAQANSMMANGFFDPDASFLAYYRFDALAKYNTIVDGPWDSARLYKSEDATVVNYNNSFGPQFAYLGQMVFKGGFVTSDPAGGTANGLKFGATGNQVCLYDDGSGNPYFDACGSNADISFYFRTKGAGIFRFVNGGIWATRLQTSDQGQCTMTAGTCAAQKLSSTYGSPPLCFANWTGTGTLAGIIKIASTTTTVTPSSSVGTDTAQVNYVCLGN